VYLSLESAARLLASSLANETVQIVNYRYGDNVGNVTNNAVRVVGNMAMTSYNFSTMGVRGIAKKTATGAGIALMEDYENRSVGYTRGPCPTRPPPSQPKSPEKGNASKKPREKGNASKKPRSH